MNPFNYESNAFWDGFREIEKGVYIKHYGAEFIECEIAQDILDIRSFGDIDTKASFWQKQLDDSLDCVAIKSIIDHSLSNVDINQIDITAESLKKGFLQQDCGASLDDFLEILKLDLSNTMQNTNTVELVQNSTLKELTEYVDSNDEVICYVNKALLDCAENYGYQGLNADSLVHVIGVRFEDDNDYVVINDTSNDVGAGMMIPLDRFLQAWSTSDYMTFIVSRR